jgi:hypothetical protein
MLYSFNESDVAGKHVGNADSGPEPAKLQRTRSYVGGLVNQTALGQHVLTGKQPTGWETESARRHDEMREQ